MDPIDNPYAPGAGTLPPALTGRDGEIERFEFLIGRLAAGRSERSMIMHGLRGVGKTVLLAEMASRVERFGWVGARSEIRRESDFGLVAERLVAGVIASLRSRGPVREALTRAARALASFSTTVSTDGSVRFGLELEPQRGVADSGDLELDLVELIGVLGEACREGGVGAVLLLDELQLLERGELESLVAAMHSASQNQLPIALVGAGLPTLPGKILDAKTYAERLFRFPELGRLGEAAAVAALVQPAAELGVEFTDNALAKILAESDGYPYFIQEWGRAAWNAASGKRIDSEALQRAELVVGEELDHDFFGLRVERATDSELVYCNALASLGEGPQAAGEVAKAMGRTTRGVSTIRAHLVDKGLIYAAGRGEVAFTVPHFGRHLLRRG